MTDPLICSRCVLPHAPPDILIGDDGVCSFCRTHRLTGNMKQESSELTAASASGLLETDFLRMIEKFRGKGDYDCLVMCSGGKDSTASLYYMAKRYEMKPLAFTFDHGFETSEALQNIERASRILGVDHMIFRSRGLMPVLRHLLQQDSKAVICHVCSIWYMNLTFRIASRFNTPLIIAGWTKGQARISRETPLLSKCACNADALEYRAMGRATEEFVSGLKGVPGLEDFPQSMEEVIYRASRRSALFFGSKRPQVLSPHWFLPSTEDEYRALIKRELGWKQPEISYPAGSTNCLLNFLAVDRCIRFWGYTHYHVELSKLIRAGHLSRQEAMERLQKNYNKELLDDVIKRIG